MTPKCPVCRQTAYPTTNNNIFRHRDSLGLRPCPGSGLPIRVTKEEL